MSKYKKIRKKRLHTRQARILTLANAISISRILLAIPFLKELIKKKSKIILISHLGRPKGKINESLSLSPVFRYLKRKIDSKIFFYNGEINEEAKDKSKKLKKGEILFLENIRFFKEEEENDEKFSKIPQCYLLL